MFFLGVGKHIDFKFDIHKDASAEIVSNLVANKLVQQAQGEEIQALLEKMILKVKETPAGNIQVRLTRRIVGSIVGLLGVFLTQIIL